MIKQRYVFCLSVSATIGVNGMEMHHAPFVLYIKEDQCFYFWFGRLWFAAFVFCAFQHLPAFYLCLQEVCFFIYEMLELF